MLPVSARATVTMTLHDCPGVLSYFRPVSDTQQSWATFDELCSNLLDRNHLCSRQLCYTTKVAFINSSHITGFGVLGLVGLYPVYEASYFSGCGSGWSRMSKIMIRRGSSAVVARTVSSTLAGISLVSLWLCNYFSRSPLPTSACPVPDMYSSLHDTISGLVSCEYKRH